VQRPQMSEDASNMEVDDPKTTDIPALKEAAKEVMEKLESEVCGENDDKNGDAVNGIVANGDTCANGNGEEFSSQKDGEEKDEEMEVEAPSTAENQNGDSEKDSHSKSAVVETGEGHIDKCSEVKTDNSDPGENNKDNSISESSKESPSADDTEVETINDSPQKKTPKKKDEPALDEPLRRSSRKKTPTKYHEMLIKEMEMESPSEEEIEEVEEIKDDDSDIQEIEAEDPLGSESSLSITPKNKKANVVTIDDLKTLQRLATSAKQSVDKAKSDNLMIIDTQSIIAGKMGSGVSITPAKPKTISTPTTPSGLNISPAGVTLGSGVTIKPNKPSSTQGVSITPATAKPASNTSTALSDPNLTDDTFVVEAPSFIVPYVYEKPPKEAILDFKEAIEKQIEDKKKAKAKKKAAGEEVSDDEEEKKKEVKKDDDEEKKDDDEKKEDVPKDAYFTSTLGKFFIDLGMNFVQEFVQKDLLRQQQRRSVKDKSVAVMHAIKSLQNNLDDTKEQNEGFHFDLKKCKFCSFRSESRLVMQHHMETPHMRNFIYRCNFCEFETKIPQEVLYHMDSEHGVKGKLERAPYFHQCPQCPFEDNGKGKLTRHKVGCDKRFKSETNQTPERDWDPPAKIRPPPVRPGYTGYMNSRPGGSPSGLGQGMLRPGSSLLPRGQQFQNNRFMNNRGGMNNSANRGRPVGSYKGQADLRIPQPQLSGLSQQQLRMRGMSPQMLASQQMLAVLNQQGLSVSGGSGRNNMMIGGGSGSVTIQSLGQKGQNKNNSPSISITPLPGRNNPGQKSKGASPSPSSGSTPTIKPGQPGAGQGGKGNFVICEICDGYIKDLEQLRNHMQWIHKVKIHPKMIYNRPPLNCQKCQFRFFTDQGLERHLLGSHGLVTASMQDAANKGQDSGRCPVCGKVYQWKLLNHVAKDHGKTLKPAHLSYKCTVCTATFGQYKLFENHVYTAHSGVAKKGDKNKQAAKTGSGSVLKAPVKLSDEISIIPTKKGDKEKEKKSEVIDLDDEEEIDDVEKEVIDLDTPKKDKKEDTSKRNADDSSEEPDAKKAKADDEEKKD